MIIDLEKFVAAEQGFWNELEARLDALDFDRSARGALDLSGARTPALPLPAPPPATSPGWRRFPPSANCAAPSARSSPAPTRKSIRTPARDPRSSRRGPAALRVAVPWSFPRAFRRHLRAFWLSVAATLVGVAFGGLAVAIDPDAKPVLLPFPQLLGDPADRVAQEEQEPGRTRSRVARRRFRVS